MEGEAGRADGDVVGGEEEGEFGGALDGVGSALVLDVDEGDISDGANVNVGNLKNDVSAVSRVGAWR